MILNKLTGLLFDIPVLWNGPCKERNKKENFLAKPQGRNPALKNGEFHLILPELSIIRPKCHVITWHNLALIRFIRQSHHITPCRSVFSVFITPHLNGASKGVSTSRFPRRITATGRWVQAGSLSNLKTLPYLWETSKIQIY